jgi:hypothetical protein
MTLRLRLVSFKFQVSIQDNRTSDSSWVPWFRFEVGLWTEWLLKGAGLQKDSMVKLGCWVEAQLCGLDQGERGNSAG